MSAARACQHCGQADPRGLCIPLPPGRRDRVFYLCLEPCAPLPVLHAIIEGHVR